MPHECYVAAKVPLARLREALERRAGAFTLEQPATEIDRDGNYIGEHRGATYLFDGEMIVAMGSSPDLFANLSAELKTSVVACGYETVSASYTFIAAENGRLVRFFSTSSASRKALSMGGPLASEARTPLGSVPGIHAALAALGFDVAGWHDSAGKTAIGYPEGCEKWASEDGPLGLRAAHAAHQKEHGIPFDQWSKDFAPRVVLTSSNDPSASFSLRDGNVGFRIEMRAEPAETPTPSWYQRLRAWFGR